MTSIGKFAFEGCSGLTDVFYSGTIHQWESMTIAERKDELSVATIHCTDGDIQPQN